MRRRDPDEPDWENMPIEPVGYTEGGAPYGATREDVRDSIYEEGSMRGAREAFSKSPSAGRACTSRSGGFARSAEESRILDKLDNLEAADARTWAKENLPPDEPSAFLHGDLLGQNIVLQLEGPPAVIDWEYARLGDPASDLAIVTRGVRKPFKMAGGLERLLEAYREVGGSAVEMRHVRFFELCMVAGWLRAALRSPEQVGLLEQAKQKFRVVLEMALQS
jgi:aminoglycoside phosphotransferase (APT) family kinase protein